MHALWRRFLHDRIICCVILVFRLRRWANLLRAADHGKVPCIKCFDRINLIHHTSPHRLFLHLVDRSNSVASIQVSQLMDPDLALFSRCREEEPVFACGLNNEGEAVIYRSIQVGSRGVRPKPLFYLLSRRDPLDVVFYHANRSVSTCISSQLAVRVLEVRGGSVISCLVARAEAIHHHRLTFFSCIGIIVTDSAMCLGDGDS